MMIPTRRTEIGYIIFQVATDGEIEFDPDDTWVQFRDLLEHQSAIFRVSEIPRIIEALQRIHRMNNE